MQPTGTAMQAQPLSNSASIATTDATKSAMQAYEARTSPSLWQKLKGAFKENDDEPKASTTATVGSETSDRDHSREDSDLTVPHGVAWTYDSYGAQVPVKQGVVDSLTGANKIKAKGQHPNDYPSFIGLSQSPVHASGEEAPLQRQPSLQQPMTTMSTLGQGITPGVADPGASGPRDFHQLPLQQRAMQAFGSGHAGQP